MAAIQELREIRTDLRGMLKRFHKVAKALEAQGKAPALVELSYAVEDVWRAIDLINNILAMYFGESP